MIDERFIGEHPLVQELQGTIESLQDELAQCKEDKRNQRLAIYELENNNKELDRVNYNLDMEVNHLRNERETLRSENTRLQNEIGRLQDRLYSSRY